MNITINKHEKDILDKTLEILNRYSAMYSALVKGCTGMHTNTAGTAAHMIETIIKDSYIDTEMINKTEV